MARGWGQGRPHLERLIEPVTCDKGKQQPILSKARPRIIALLPSSYSTLAPDWSIFFLAALQSCLVVSWIRTAAALCRSEVCSLIVALHSHQPLCPTANGVFSPRSSQFPAPAPIVCVGRAFVCPGREFSRLSQ